MIPSSAVLTTASGPYGEKPLVFRRTFFREVGLLNRYLRNNDWLFGLGGRGVAVAWVRGALFEGFTAFGRCFVGSWRW